MTKRHTRFVNNFQFSNSLTTTFPVKAPITPLFACNISAGLFEISCELFRTHIFSNCAVVRWYCRIVCQRWFRVLCCTYTVIFIFWEYSAFNKLFFVLLFSHSTLLSVASLVLLCRAGLYKPVSVDRTVEYSLVSELLCVYHKHGTMSCCWAVLVIFWSL